MIKKTFILLMLLLLAGCSSVNDCAKNKLSPLKTYTPATQISKDELSNDLRSGKIKIGDTIESIRTNYGDPDSMFTSDCIIRINYKSNTEKNITLWFENGENLSMWKD